MKHITSATPVLPIKESVPVERRIENGKWVKPKRFVDFLRRLLLSENFVLYLSITYFLILSIFIPSLAEPRNLSNQLLNVWSLLAVAVGQTFVLIIAGIDLSQGSIMAITQGFWAERQTTNREKTIPTIYDRLNATGRLDAWRLNWRFTLARMLI